jgi:hypothetical protein
MSRGNDFFDRIHGLYGGLTPAEEELITEIGRQLDLVDRLHEDSTDPRELRQQRSLLNSMIKTLSLPELQPVSDKRGKAATRAAQARWRR